MMTAPSNLRADAIRVDDRAAIDGDVDARHGDIALLVDRRLDHRRHVAHEAAMDGEAKAVAFRQLALAPARLLGDEFDDVAQAVRCRSG